MELRILGCSGGEAEGERLTGLLVNRQVAIDAGSLTQALTVEEQIAVRHVFLSHSHLDHMCTLPFYTKNIFGHTPSPVGIRALPETLDAGGAGPRRVRRKSFRVFRALPRLSFSPLPFPV